METPVAADLSAADELEKLYDSTCKQLLAHKIILAWIMHSCLEEYKNIDPKEIAEKYIESEPEVGEIGVLPNQTNLSIHGMANEDTSINEGTVVYDIRFSAAAPDGDGFIKLIINVEAQNKYHLSYSLITRALFYLSRMISSQYGTEFEHSHYEDIKKVYSIWICANPPKNRENTITQYRIREENLVGDIHEDERNYDLINATMICMGDAEDSEGILRMLNTLLDQEKNANQRKQTLLNEFGIAMTQQMEEEVEKMCNLSQSLIEKGIEKGIKKGIQQGRQEGIQQGIQRGIQQGRQEGRQEGIQQGIYSALQNLMHNAKMSFEQAVLMLGIPKEEQEIYKKLLESKA